MRVTQPLAMRAMAARLLLVLVGAQLGGPKRPPEVVNVGAEGPLEKPLAHEAKMKKSRMKMKIHVVLA